MGLEAHAGVNLFSNEHCFAPQVPAAIPNKGYVLAVVWSRSSTIFRLRPCNIREGRARSLYRIAAASGCYNPERRALV